MKKTMLAIALCATAVSACAAEWYYMGDTSFDTSMAANFIDKSSISCRNKLCKMWDAMFFLPLFNTSLG